MAKTRRTTRALATMVMGFIALFMACGNPGGGEPSPTPFVSQRWPSDEECVDAAPSTTVELRPIGPGGQLERVVVPVIPDDPGDPIDIGPYRLLPWGYDGPSLQNASVEAAVGRDDWGATQDDVEITSSRVYVETGFVPKGFVPLSVDAATIRGEVAQVSWTYDGPSESRVILARRDLTLYPSSPFEIPLTACDSFFYHRSGEFKGHTMITAVRFMDDEVIELVLIEGSILTKIEGDVADGDELIRMLESLDPPIAAATPGP
jgi:hypothetical protein